jgi:hypothetical protein
LVVGDGYPLLDEHHTIRARLVVGDGYPWVANPHAAFPCACGIPSGYGKVTVSIWKPKKREWKGTGTRHAKLENRPLFTTYTPFFPYNFMPTSGDKIVHPPTHFNCRQRIQSEINIETIIIQSFKN